MDKSEYKITWTIDTANLTKVEAKEAEIDILEEAIRDLQSRLAVSRVELRDLEQKKRKKEEDNKKKISNIQVKISKKRNHNNYSRDLIRSVCCGVIVQRSYLKDMDDLECPKCKGPFIFESL